MDCWIGVEQKAARRGDLRTVAFVERVRASDHSSIGIDDGELAPVTGDMAQDEGKGAPSDRAKPDHYDGAIPGRVLWPEGHFMQALRSSW